MHAKAGLVVEGNTPAVPRTPGEGEGGRNLCQHRRWRGRCRHASSLLVLKLGSPSPCTHTPSPLTHETGPVPMSGSWSDRTEGVVAPTALPRHRLSPIVGAPVASPVTDASGQASTRVPPSAAAAATLTSSPLPAFSSPGTVGPCIQTDCGMLRGVTCRRSPWHESLPPATRTTIVDLVAAATMGDASSHPPPTPRPRNDISNTPFSLGWP